jgi:hypothetical protein
MNLRNVQKLELVWFVLGFVFNCLSYRQLYLGFPAYSATDPIAGNVFMAICGVIIFLGLKGFSKTYKYVIPFLTLSLTYSGWFLHIKAYFVDATLPDYASFYAWLAVVIINSFGVITMIAGSWMAFSKRSI